MNDVELHTALQALDPTARQELFNELSPEELDQLAHVWEWIARPSQLAPPGAWSVWLLLAGRGFGKTRSGVEWVRQRVANGSRYISLISRTPADVRDVLIEGESGLLSCYPRHERPVYSPSKRCVDFANGAKALVFSSYEPDQLRGIQSDSVLADEICAWDNIEETWRNALLGLRLGQDTRAMITTTPRNIPLLKGLLKQADDTASGVVVTRGTTYENIRNLSPVFVREVLSLYEGTTIGRQELLAELLDAVEGAMWKRQWIDSNRRARPEHLKRIVVSVDPSTSEHGKGNAAGLIAAGLGEDGHVYVLADHSLQGSPDAWARATIGAYEALSADRVVAEGNQGAGLVTLTLRTLAPNLPVKIVQAKRGKQTRAEPIAALYEQGRVHHTSVFAALEDELCTWTVGEDSPDRLDALCWAIHELALKGGETKTIRMAI